MAPPAPPAPPAPGHLLKLLVEQRLSAAAEEIFGLFQKTIAEYEQEVRRQRKLLDAVFRPEVRLHRADVQQLLASPDVPPEQQDSSSGPDQEVQQEVPPIKEESEDPWSGRRGEQLPGLKEAEILEFTFTPALVRSEGDEEKPQSSQLLRSDQDTDAEGLKTEADGEKCEVVEPLVNFEGASHYKTCLYELDTDDSYVWEEPPEPPSGSHPQNNLVPVTDQRNTNFLQKEHLQNHFGGQTRGKPFSCSVCGNAFTQMKSLKNHMRLHSEKKNFSCPVCQKTFLWKTVLDAHVRIHTGEKPYSCSVCGTSFTHSSNLTAHLRIHSGVKPFTCSVCQMSFGRRHHLSRHLKIHTGEKPFSCFVCAKTFRERAYLRRHLNGHAGETSGLKY